MLVLRKFICVGFVSIIFGCSDGGIKSVEWFKNNPEEMKKQLLACAAGDEDLVKQNCINAKEASATGTWTSTKLREVKPLTAEDFKKNNN